MSANCSARARARSMRAPAGWISDIVPKSLHSVIAIDVRKDTHDDYSARLTPNTNNWFGHIKACRRTTEIAMDALSRRYRGDLWIIGRSRTNQTSILMRRSGRDGFIFERLLTVEAGDGSDKSLARSRSLRHLARLLDYKPCRLGGGRTGGSNWNAMIKSQPIDPPQEPRVCTADAHLVTVRSKAALQPGVD